MHHQLTRGESPNHRSWNVTKGGFDLEAFYAMNPFVRRLKASPQPAPTRIPAPGAIRIVAIGVAFLVMGATARALDNAWTLRQYAGEALGKKRGLPGSAVYDVAQTLDGYIWFATEEGLARYDGVRMRVYNSASAPELPGNFVRALAADPDGGLWVGTDRALARLKEGEITNLTAWLGQPVVDVRNVSLAPDGSLWVGSNLGVHRISHGSVVRYTAKDGLLEGEVRALLGVSGQAAWIGTSLGLVHLENGRVRVFTAQEGLPDNDVCALCPDPDGAVWVGTTRGLASCRQGIMAPVALPNELGPVEVRALLCDGRDVLWIGTSAGLLRKKGAAVERIDKHDGLADNFIVSLKIDREGTFWAGTMYGGVAHFRNPSVTLTGKHEGLAGDNMACVLESRDRSLWVGEVESGIDRLKDGRVEHFSTGEGLPSNFVLSLCETPEGILWAGTAAGLADFDGRRFVAAGAAVGGPTNAVFAMEGDRAGNLWAGTRAGLWRRDREGWRVLTPADGMPRKQIIALHQAKDGALWIGTADGGLVRYLAGQFETFSTAQGLPDEHVLDIFEDRDGVIWISTDQGLSRLKNGLFRTASRKNGLLSDSNFRVLADDQGYFWMSSNQGISRARKSELDLVADGRAARFEIEAYGADEGMREAECNGAVQPAGNRASDGRLWFPTSQGMAVIDPRKLWKNPVAPKAVVEQVWTGKRSWPAVDGNRLPAAIGELRFVFSAPTFVAAERARFRYRLEGLETEWHEVDDHREANYVNLPPGKFVFTVVAANSQGKWSETGASLAFVKLPYFHQTAWFYGLCAMAAAGAFWGAQRWQARAYTRRQRELARRVREALAEIKTLSGLLPICAWCKKIRNDQGYWEQIETYLRSRSNVTFTHSMCRECEAKWDPEGAGSAPADGPESPSGSR
jgi:ligand-binding sensor domain-containing protein